MKWVRTVEVRALAQNASSLVARAARGEVIIITDRGRPIAQLTPLAGGRVRQLVESGRARPPRRPISQLPKRLPGPSLASAVLAARDDERG